MSVLVSAEWQSASKVSLRPWPSLTINGPSPNRMKDLSIELQTAATGELKENIDCRTSTKHLRAKGKAFFVMGLQFWYPFPKEIEQIQSQSPKEVRQSLLETALPP